MNIKYFSIYENSEYITIKNNFTREALNIYYKGLQMTHFKEHIEINKKLLECDGIIGIININNFNYLVFISESEEIFSFDYCEIYKVTNVGFISLDSLRTNKLCENEEKLDELKEIIINGFFFSNKYDLSNSQSAQYQIKKELKSDLYDSILESNTNFLANLKFIRNFIQYHKNLQEYNDKLYLDHFISSCIYGNIEKLTYEIKEDTIDYIIISRRYIWGFGIENLKRGLGKYSNVANQVETESIFIFNYNTWFSYLILSGSIPVYFIPEEKQKSNKVKKSFREYMKDKFDEYKLIAFISFNNDKNSVYQEKFLKLLLSNQDAYKNKFKYFLIVKEDNIKNFLKRITDLINLFGYNENEFQSLTKTDFEKEMEIEQYRIKKKQLGIFSLIGTDFEKINELSMIIAFTIIQNIIEKVKTSKNELDIDSILGKNVDVLGKDLSKSNSEETIIWNNNYMGKGNEFTEKFKLIWKYNYIKLIKQYKTIHTEEDKIRIYQRNLEILFNSQQRKIPIYNQIKNYQSLYADKSKIKIYIATWNAGATNNNDFSLEKLLLLPLEKMPNIYFIGFQEVIMLNAVNVVSPDKHKLFDIWNNRICKVINSYKEINYMKIGEMCLGGIAFFVFIKSSDLDYIKDSPFITEYIKTGLGGTSGNKGSCLFSFNYNNTVISVSCSHLCAGAEKNQNRINQLIDILDFKLISSIEKKNSNNFNQNKDDSEILTLNNYLSNNNIQSLENSNLLFKNSDIFFIFGDLNFRIDTNYENFKDFVKGKSDWKKLLDYDQLNKSRKATMELDILNEMEINFQPTYKYCVDSNEFDYTLNENLDNNLKKSGKKRNPSWCDRILYKKNNKHQNIIGLEYHSVMDEEFQDSDHRPVYAIFEVQVMKDNVQKKNEVLQEIVQNYNMGISSSYMKKKIYSED